MWMNFGGGRALFDAWMDGEIDADDPRLSTLPAHLREQIERITQQEAEHEAKIAPILAARENVLKSLGEKFDGSVAIPVGERPKVLVITELSMTSTQWYHCHLFGIEEPGPDTQDGTRQSDEKRRDAADAWIGIDVENRSFSFAEDVAKVRLCQEAIVSGEYHAVVVCDLSLRDLMEAPDLLFDHVLGSHLQAFARAGGWVGFPTSDGMLLTNMGVLSRLFGVEWRVAAYTAETWGPLPRAETGGVFVAPVSMPTPHTVSLFASRKRSRKACIVSCSGRECLQAPYREGQATFLPSSLAPRACVSNRK